MAKYIATKQRDGFDFTMPQLLLISYLRKHTEVDVSTFSGICQHTLTNTKDILEQASLPPFNILEKRGKKKGVTYHLSKNLAKELIGKAAYTRIKGIDRQRYEELIQNYVNDHGSITNKEVRELLVLGDSNYSYVKASVILKRLTDKKILNALEEVVLRSTRNIRKIFRHKKTKFYPLSCFSNTWTHRSKFQ